MFCRVQRRRKAVSEMLAALILIVIVIAGFSVLVYPQLQRYVTTSQQLGKQAEGTNAGVQISLVYAYAAQSGSTTSVTAYLDSYGIVPPSTFYLYKFCHPISGVVHFPLFEHLHSYWHSVFHHYIEVQPTGEFLFDVLPAELYWI